MQTYFRGEQPIQHVHIMSLRANMACDYCATVIKRAPGNWKSLKCMMTLTMHYLLWTEQHWALRAALSMRATLYNYKIVASQKILHWSWLWVTKSGSGPDVACGPLFRDPSSTTTALCVWEYPAVQAGKQIRFPDARQKVVLRTVVPQLLQPWAVGSAVYKYRCFKALFKLWQDWTFEKWSLFYFIFLHYIHYMTT